MQFLFDLSLLGEAVGRACRDNRLRRINYEVLGNSLPVLHGHVHARYDWEPPDMVGGPVWRYPQDERNDPALRIPTRTTANCARRSRRNSTA